MARVLGWLRVLRTEGWGVPIALVGLAAVAFASAYAASSVNSEDAGAAREERAAVSFSETLPPEPGPDGLPWTWIGDFAAMSATASGRYWLGVKAASLQRPRVLDFEDASGDKPISAEIGVAPQLYVLGPLDISGRLQLGLRPRPGASTAGLGDDRKLAIFLSQPRLFRHPIIALPGGGFWATETTSRGLPFNWLRGTGQIDLRAADEDLRAEPVTTPRDPDSPIPVQSTSPPPLLPLPRLDRSRSRRAWLTFVALSNQTSRTLSVRGGGVSETLEVPNRGPRPAGRRFTVGPIELRDGQATITVTSQPGSRAVGADPRLRSVRLSQLEALPSPPRRE